VELTVECDKGSFTASRVRDEATTMIRTLIRLMETMKPVPEVRRCWCRSPAVHFNGRERRKDVRQHATCR
jgi:hypothetical protein